MDPRVKTAAELAEIAEAKRRAISEIAAKLKDEEAAGMRLQMQDTQRTLAIVAALYDVGATVAEAVNRLREK